MLGQMQDWPLTVDKVLDRAAQYAGDNEIVTRRADGSIHRSNYATLHARAKQVSAALLDLGIVPGDRVATLAMNSERHLESWYGTMGIGAVLHTLNPRLHPDQLAWIANHAGDRVVILDSMFVPLIEAVKDRIAAEHYVIIADRDQMPETSFAAICYEDWIGGHGTDVQWGGFDENAACGLCYTSGTTGDPKGVLYSHRSNVLHAMISLTNDCFGLGYQDTVMPVVPMFHANAWALAFAAPMVGAKMVMPAAGMDGGSLYELLDTERVTVSAAVPTLWMGLLDHLRAHNLMLPHLRFVAIGGSALPEVVLRAFEQEYDVRIGHAWGMTEMSPIGTVCRLPLGGEDAPLDEQIVHKLKQGVPLFGTEVKVVGDDGAELPWGTGRSGRLLVRGMAVVDRYFRADKTALDADGWFDTGDLATVDDSGAMKLTDRAKDVIKSGGEWISSIDLENAILSHPGVAFAAAIAMPDPRWGERPLLVIQPAAGANPTEADLRAFLADRIAKWWMPDEFAFVDAIPLGATGKVNKLALRETFTGRATVGPA
ncbi:long-chain-fatty-acid--CoA ligase [Croceicoccus ponticola]|uniref:3-methylmercaptopropionyl-CoA ligase n=1 Tax=Croceicoccus ponticola TaxID=2217664 RepID=A0A437GUX6_9SPHN|nr:long-chain-fatty-acid--CoA ligase [Croceicoccus ponticola]RVQ65443.1 long-chain-fatty-acid--CoA ligase [Croceicoccus ponticola]